MKALKYLIAFLLIASASWAGDLYVNHKFSGSETGAIATPFNTVQEAVDAITFPLTEAWTIHVRGTKGAEDDGVTLDMADFDDWSHELFKPLGTDDGTADYRITVTGYAGDAAPPIFTLASELSGTWVQVGATAVWYLDVSANNWNMGVADTQGFSLNEDLTDAGFYNVETAYTDVNASGEFSVTFSGVYAVRIYMQDKNDANPNTSGHTYYFSPTKTNAGQCVQFDLETGAWSDNSVAYWTINNLTFNMSGRRAIWATGPYTTLSNLKVWGAGVEGIKTRSEDKEYGASYITVEDCEVSYIGSECTYCGQGVQWNTSSGTIRRNKLHDNQISGVIVLGGYNTVEQNQAYNNVYGIYIEQESRNGSPSNVGNVVQHNYSYDNGIGIWIAGGHSSTYRYNLLVNNDGFGATTSGGINESDLSCGHAAELSGDDCYSKENLYYNNTVSNNTAGTGIILTSRDHTGGPPITYIKNNIIISTSGDAGSYMLRMPMTDQVVSDYNQMFYTADWTVKWGGSDYTSLAAYQGASSQDANSDDADPVVITPNSVFTLQVTSPCIDNAVSLGTANKNGLNPTSTWTDGVITSDQDLFGAGWDMGAYVYDLFISSASPTGTGIGIDTDLNWTNPTGTVTVDVYFEEVSGACNLEIGDRISTGTLIATKDQGAMTVDTAYCWRVDVIHAGGTEEGVVYEFTTTGGPPAPPAGLATCSYHSLGLTGSYDDQGATVGE